MKQRFTAEQVVAILREADGKDAKVRDVCRQHGITEQTFCRWRQVYGGLQVSEAKRLTALEEENRRLRRLVADQSARHRHAERRGGANVVTATHRRQAVTHLEPGGWLRLAGNRASSLSVSEASRGGGQGTTFKAKSD